MDVLIDRVCAPDRALSAPTWDSTVCVEEQVEFGSKSIKGVRYRGAQIGTPQIGTPNLGVATLWKLELVLVSP